MERHYTIDRGTFVSQPADAEAGQCEKAVARSTRPLTGLQRQLVGRENGAGRKSWPARIDRGFWWREVSGRGTCRLFQMGWECKGAGENRGRGSAEAEARVPRRPGPLSLVRTVQSGGTSLSCKYNNVQSPSADFVTLKTFSSLSLSLTLT